MGSAVSEAQRKLKNGFFARSMHADMKGLRFYYIIELIATNPFPRVTDHIPVSLRAISRGNISLWEMYHLNKYMLELLDVCTFFRGTSLLINLYNIL